MLKDIEHGAGLREIHERKEKNIMLEKGTKVRVTYRPTVIGKNGSRIEFWGYVEKAIEDEGYILAVPFQEIDAVRYIYSPDYMTLITVAADKVAPYCRGCSHE